MTFVPEVLLSEGDYIPLPQPATAGLGRARSRLAHAAPRSAMLVHMGAISDWMTGSALEMEQFAGWSKSFTLDEARAAEELVIERVDKRRVLLLADLWCAMS